MGGARPDNQLAVRNHSKISCTPIKQRPPSSATRHLITCVTSTADCVDTCSLDTSSAPINDTRLTSSFAFFLFRLLDSIFSAEAIPSFDRRTPPHLSRANRRRWPVVRRISAYVSNTSPAMLSRRVAQYGLMVAFVGTVDARVQEHFRKSASLHHSAPVRDKHPRVRHARRSIMPLRLSKV